MSSGGTLRFVLVGVGNVGRRFLQLIEAKREVLYERYGLELVLVGAADASGAAYSATGLDVGRVIELKRASQAMAGYPELGRARLDAREMVAVAEADLLLEASPANLRDGQPGLGCIETALSRGMHVVTANKAPLVLAYPRLMELARAHGALLRFDATVAGGLPVVNLGQRDLAAAEIERVEGLLNLTANLILTRMAEDGLSYAQALAEAQAAGHAEADPSLDVEGWDAAQKLVILANSVLGATATLDDVAVEGITGITEEALRQAGAEGKRIKLLALAEREEGGYRLRVGPVWLAIEHPLARLGAKQMGVAFHTDTCGTLFASHVEETPVPTAYAMLRDVLDVVRSEGLGAQGV